MEALLALVRAIACFIVLMLARPASAQTGAEPWAVAPPEPIDSLRYWVDLGLHPAVLADGDSVLIDAYASLLAPGDTIWPRRWALYGKSWLLAQAWKRNFRHAAVLFIWPQSGDTLLQMEPVARWSLIYSQDSLGCWYIVNDTTPVSTCVARDDPDSPVRDLQRLRP